MKITKARLRELIQEEMDAMRGAERPGAGIEDIAEPELEEPSRKVSGETAMETLLAFMKAREELVKMSANDRRAFRRTLDPAQAEVFDHIITHPLYRPIPKHMQREETVELAEQRLPPNLAPEYLAGLRDLIAKHGREKVAQAYKNAGGTDRQVAPIRAIKSML